MIPSRQALRVVGDVHGDARGFAAALAGAPFVVQLGDLTDGDGDSAAVLRLALDMLEAGRGLFLLGNHDHKLARALAGRPVRRDAALAATLAALSPELGERALAALRAAPAWAWRAPYFFVHAAFHPAMCTQAPPPFSSHVSGLLGRALYGQTTGRLQPDGYPERRHDWVDRIPAGLTVFCGHDNRSGTGQPLRLRGAAGGEAVFLDTGAGKGGHLSWIDLAEAQDAT